MEKRHLLLIIALIAASIVLVPSVYSFLSGEHTVYDTGASRCLKCHPDIKEELDASIRHTYFSCENCHAMNGVSSQLHESEAPRCLDCHAIPLRQVTDSNNNAFLSPLAKVFGENIINAESHTPFVNGAISDPLMEGENEACVSCHLAFNYDVSFKRPEFVEWDVSNSSGAWTIGNLVLGQNKIVNEKNSIQNFDGKLHNVVAGEDQVNCITCHQDIKMAVMAGGHSNEQWGKNHGYSGYADFDSYCRSCHKPLTQNYIGISPYPSNPFNLPVHSAMTITCMDCHSRSGNLFVNINGAIKTPPYNSDSMGGIENSISSQPAFIRGYFCLACKNTGNPVPNSSIHFKLYTEPQVMIYVNGAQQYP